MALNGINSLVAVTQMKASNANDTSVQNQPQSAIKPKTSFSTLSSAISEVMKSLGSALQTAARS
jgi:hypothetical protein